MRRSTLLCAFLVTSALAPATFAQQLERLPEVLQDCGYACVFAQSVDATPKSCRFALEDRPTSHAWLTLARTPPVQVAPQDFARSGWASLAGFSGPETTSHAGGR
jgi:hypothetical protein